MSKDLPVTKRTNVMVGITRSKAITYFVRSPPWHLYILLLANLLAFYLTVSSGFQISPSFHHRKNLVNSPGFQQIFTRFWISQSFHPPKKKLWWIHRVFTKFSPGFETLLRFYHPKKTWWIHQVFTRFWNFTKFSPKKTWWIHQVFTRFWNFTKFSPQKKLGEFTRFSPSFWNFTSFQVNSPGFNQTWWIHQVFTRFSPSCHLGDFFLQIHRQNG